MRVQNIRLKLAPPSKLTSKVTSLAPHFRYFWLDSKGRKGSRGFATIKGGGKAKQRKRRERERGEAKDAKESVTSVQFGGHQNYCI